MKWRRHEAASDEGAGQGPAPLRGFDDYDIRLGDLMRGERATLGKSLLDVQRDLKISAEHIAAIENADLSPFDVPSFVAGYVRSYARYLGMDAEWAYARFCEELDFSVTHGLAPESSSRRRQKMMAQANPGSTDQPVASPGVPFAPPRDGFLPRFDPGAAGSIVVLVALIGAIGYGGWSVLREVQRVQVAPVDQAPEVVVDIDPLGNVGARPDGPPSLAAPGDSTAAAALERFYRPEALDVPVLVPRDGPIADIKPEASPFDAPQQGLPAVVASDAAEGAPFDLAGAAALPDASQDGGTVSETDSAIAAAVAEATVRVLADPPPEVEIFAVQPAWVRVRAADGTVLFEKILDPGERYRVPASEAAATLRAGNSGSVYFLVNGTAFGPAAVSSQVVKDVALTAASLSERYRPADPGDDGALARFIAQLVPADGGPARDN
jgi:cytoskeletal protein RodZ